MQGLRVRALSANVDTHSHIASVAQHVFPPPKSPKPVQEMIRAYFTTCLWKKKLAMPFTYEHPPPKMFKVAVTSAKNSQVIPAPTTSRGRDKAIYAWQMQRPRNHVARQVFTFEV
jgi:hypothetical protein